MKNNKIIKINGSYDKVRDAISRCPAYDSLKNIGYLYCFNSAVNPNKIKIGSTANIVNRLKQHQNYLRSYGESRIDQILVSVPVVAMRNAEERIKKLFKSAFSEINGGDWFEGQMDEAAKILMAQNFDTPASRKNQIELTDAELALVLDWWFMDNNCESEILETKIGRTIKQRLFEMGYLVINCNELTQNSNNNSSAPM